MGNNVAEDNREGEKPLDPGTRLGRYQIVHLLGHGGMGAVYEALHVDLKKRVALKTLLRKHASNQDLRARFLREGEAASRIRHPNVVDVTDVGMDRGHPYLVMEYLSGESLAQRLAREERLPLRSAVALMLPVFSAVAEGHRRGVVHRDLKPHNIFITKNRAGAFHPKVLDFGISKLRDDNRIQTVTEGSTFLGTVTYMSPEQARAAKTVDGRSDEYSLAVVLYQVVTGKTPHEAENTIELIYKIAAGEMQAPRVYQPDLPPAFETILLKALSTNPTDRFDSVRAFGAALLPFADAGSQQEWQPDFVGPPRPLTPAPPAPSESTLQSLGTLSGGASATTLSGSALESLRPVSPPKRHRVPRLPIAMAVGAVIVAAGVFALVSRRDHVPIAAPAPAAAVEVIAPAPAVAAPATPPEVVLQTDPPFARIELDGVHVGEGQHQFVPHDAHAVHRVRISAKGFATRELSFTASRLPEVPLRLQRVQATPPPRKAPAKSMAAAPRKTPRGTNNSLIIE